MGATSKNQKSWIYFSSRKIIHSGSYLKNLLHMSNLILWTNYILWSCSTLKFWLTLNEFSRQNQDFKNRQLHPSDQTDGWILLFFRFHRACYTWPPNACAPHSRDHLPLCLEFQTSTRKRWKSIKRTERWFEKNESEIVNHDYSNLDSTIRSFLEKYYNWLFYLLIFHRSCAIGIPFGSPSRLSHLGRMASDYNMFLLLFMIIIWESIKKWWHWSDDIFSVHCWKECFVWSNDGNQSTSIKHHIYIYSGICRCYNHIHITHHKNSWVFSKFLKNQAASGPPSVIYLRHRHVKYCEDKEDASRTQDVMTWCCMIFCG